MAAILEKELDFFKRNQESLVKNYNGKILVIHNQSVVGVFDDRLDAYLSAKAQFEPGSFMIQQCIPGPKAYTVNISTLGAIDYGRQNN